MTLGNFLSNSLIQLGAFFIRLFTIERIFQKIGAFLSKPSGYNGWLSFAGKLEHLVVGSNPLVRDPLLSGDDRTRGVLHHLQRVQASQVQVLPD